MREFLTLGAVPYGTGFVKPFDQVFPKAIMVTPADIEAGSVDALVIWGGSDIHPSIYGELNKGSHVGSGLSLRDEVEVAVCKAAISRGIPIIGVCRGAQLACALAGGKLYQDVSGHHGDHEIENVNGETYVTSSIHHQMMDVREMSPDNYQMLAWTKEPRAKQVGGDVEPEIVYFPKIKALAIQGHPEFMDRNDTFVQYCMKLVQQYTTEQA